MTLMSAVFHRILKKTSEPSCATTLMFTVSLSSAAAAAMGMAAARAARSAAALSAAVAMAGVETSIRRLAESRGLEDVATMAFDRDAVFEESGVVEKEMTTIVATLSEIVRDLNGDDSGGSGGLGMIVKILNEHHAALETFARRVETLRETDALTSLMRDTRIDDGGDS